QMQPCELTDLLADQLQLRQCARVTALPALENPPGAVDGSPQRGRPPAQGMNDRTQRCEGARGRLPSICGCDQADRQTIHVRAWVLGSLLDVVNGILDQSRNGAMVAGARNDEPIRLAHGFQQLASFLRGSAGRSQIVRKCCEGRTTEEFRS